MAVKAALEVTAAFSRTSAHLAAENLIYEEEFTKSEKGSQNKFSNVKGELDGT
ncbi:hypothetical protein [Komarekiella delphini-convector]|uniref:hypothetical protein n=1 Tax=Komarekiella delphini-convector TaxID=3050158 RepID=UPI001783BD4B|nr:hypothetical protein [Komarekiella delphini-convector]